MSYMQYTQFMYVSTNSVHAGVICHGHVHGVWVLLAWPGGHLWTMKHSSYELNTLRGKK